MSQREECIMRRIPAVALASWLTLTVPSIDASTHSTDQSDFWYKPGEEGWTVNIAHQYDTVFLTLFVYAPNGLPTGYSGSAALSASNNAGLFYTGDLYTTTGPWFGGPFNPNLVTRRQVGAFTFNARSVSQARLTYSIDGVAVVKDVERFTFRINNLTGTYTSSQRGTVSGCSSGNGPSTVSGPMVLTHNADNSIQLVLDDANDPCIVTGLYQQSGRLGSLTGNLSCGGQVVGVYTLYEIEATVSGLTARTAQEFGGSCRLDGTVGAARH
jgi:hypothetical protein